MLNLFIVPMTREILFEMLFICVSHFKCSCNVMPKKLKVLTRSSATFLFFSRRLTIFFCGIS